MLHYINGSYGHYGVTVQYSVQLSGAKVQHRQIIRALGHTCSKPLNELYPGVYPIKPNSMYYIVS